MDQKMLKLICIGTCAYFLMVDSVLSFLLQTWTSSGGMAGLFLAAAANLLMLTAGFAVWKKYPERHSRTVNSASVMLGGAAILVITGQLLLRILLMRFVNDRFQWSIASILFLVMIAAFATVGAISLWKGFERTKDDPHAAELRVLCYRSALIFLLFRGVNYLMWWLQPLFTLENYELNTRDLISSIVPVASIAAGLILYFTPLKINTAVKNLDAARDKELSGWAQIISGWLLLLTGIFDLVERLIVMVMAQFSVFGVYEPGDLLRTVLLPFAPPLILILIGLVLIVHGRKRTAHRRTKPA